MRYDTIIQQKQLTHNMELASKYDPKEIESKWYEYWLDNKLFSSKLPPM